LYIGVGNTQAVTKGSNIMKIAIASINEQTISHHFGRAEKYVVFSVEDGQVTGRLTLAKPGHRQFDSQHSGKHQHDAKGSGFGRHANSKHEQMFEPIKDCDVLLAGGMGRGAYLGLQKIGIKPIVTKITDIDSAVQAVLDDTIVNHISELH
jgi:predicted Fe-Mo cluster-binding NifX family protein